VRKGGPVKSEDDPLDPAPPTDFQRAAAAMTHLEQAVADFGGIGLRYGASDDALIEPVRTRHYPIIGSGGGFSSWIHLEDVAAATVLALEQAAPAPAELAGAAAHRRRGGCNGYRGAGRPQRQSRARPRRSLR
jgi:nucleoside-diphosphate-sugar epimerase